MLIAFENLKKELEKVSLITETDVLYFVISVTMIQAWPVAFSQKLNYCCIAPYIYIYKYMRNIIKHNDALQ